MSSLFADIKAHRASAGGKQSKFEHENSVLAAVEEVLKAEGVDPSPVAYMGALMLSLDSNGQPAAVIAATLMLLGRTLPALPSALLLSKSGKMSAAIVAAVSAHADQPAVARSALPCIQQLIRAYPKGANSGASVSKLFKWCVELTLHANPKVSARYCSLQSPSRKGQRFSSPPTHPPTASHVPALPRR